MTLTEQEQSKRAKKDLDYQNLPPNATGKRLQLSPIHTGEDVRIGALYASKVIVMSLERPGTF